MHCARALAGEGPDGSGAWRPHPNVLGGLPQYARVPIVDRCVSTIAPGGIGLDLVRAASAADDHPQLGFCRVIGGPGCGRVNGLSRRTTNGFKGWKADYRASFPELKILQHVQATLHFMARRRSTV
jgi:hypothetical protein